ncbi:MAG: response regulator [Alphaproteobacteria bacterium]
MSGDRDSAPKTHRILVIDDDDLIRLTLRAALEKAGYVVLEAPDGEKGIRLFKADPVDIVVTDIVMPEKEGIATVLELRREDPDVKIIAISGGGQLAAKDLLHFAGKLGADRILAKPFPPNRLIELVRELLSE